MNTTTTNTRFPRAALITGASAGLGRALAEDAARRGMNLVLADLPETGLPETAAVLAERYDVRADAHEVDLSSARGVNDLVDWIESGNLPVDLLVNNAAIGAQGAFADGDLGRYERLLELNVGAVLRLTHRLLPVLRRRGRGHILNVASLAAFQPTPLMSVYASGKSFVVNLSLALGAELRATGVRVSVLAPGGMTTNRESVARIQAQGFMGRITARTPQAVAREAIDGVLAGKAVIVPGWPNRLLRLLSRLAPMTFTARVAYRRFVAADARTRLPGAEVREPSKVLSAGRGAVVTAVRGSPSTISALREDRTAVRAVGAAPLPVTGRMRLPTGRRVLVTGASTGIGRALVEHLAARGDRVFAGARRPADLEALARIEGVIAVELDVTDEADVREVASSVRATGGLDALVNCAGIAVPGPLMELDAREVSRQMEVNLVGLHRVTRACFPLLFETRGRIVNISSTGGLIAMPFVGAYSASKFAVEALSDSLRRELAPFGMHVSLVQPGAVRTPIWDKTDPDDPSLDGSIFAERARGFGRMMVRRARGGGLEPERLARAVAGVLDARRPRPRYLVTEANLMTRLLAALPDGTLDWLVRRYV
jgi:hypothetical protein